MLELEIYVDQLSHCIYLETDGCMGVETYVVIRGLFTALLGLAYLVPVPKYST